MTGSFSSQEQAEADTYVPDIRLEMVHIWKERDDAFWLYVEQAAAWSLEKPYCQRVYRLLRREGGTREDAPLSRLRPDSRTERAGCAIVMEDSNGAFIGSTLGKSCGSELRGATDATSEVRIEKDLLTSWDRGF